MKASHKQIVSLMAKGMKQAEVSACLAKKGIKPNSVRMIEDTLRELKKEYRAKTLFHLAYILTKKGII
ncbi:hypothetical protein EZY14_002630 [Kordia sp. TARA_039_SRF]|nr:hypothetical protein EZY14_002630 [Kordia sp. TARA_039_SRF]